MQVICASSKPGKAQLRRISLATSSGRAWPRKATETMVEGFRCGEDSRCACCWCQFLIAAVPIDFMWLNVGFKCAPCSRPHILCSLSALPHGLASCTCSTSPAHQGAALPPHPFLSTRGFGVAWALIGDGGWHTPESALALNCLPPPPSRPLPWRNCGGRCVLSTRLRGKRPYNSASP